MKTAEEKVISFMHRHAVMFAPLPWIDLDMIRHSIRILVKEQDRDTRHACAEAVMQINQGCNCSTCEQFRNETYAAVMN